MKPSPRRAPRTLCCMILTLCLITGGCAPIAAAPVKSPQYSILPAYASTPNVETTPQVSTPMPTPYTYIDPTGDTVATRILPPEGYTRIQTDGYGAYLRNQQLLPDGSPILLYNGELAGMQDMHVAVLSIDVGKRDLQQCADAALRLRCEYLFSIGEYESINYHLTNGDAFPYAKYREGYRLQVNGNKTSLVKTDKPDESYAAFRKYLDVLFNYASTRSLFPESKEIPLSDIKIGDVFLIAASPGHCVIVMDMCEDAQGNRALLLGQGNMPAQQIHVLIEPGQDNPWLYVEDIVFPLHIGIWDFNAENVRRIP